MKTLIILTALYAQFPSVTQGIVNHHASANFCNLPHHEPRPGEIVIEWRRDKNGVCNRQVVLTK